MSDEITVGLRFKRSQERTLRRLANEFEADGRHENVTLFRMAADHAKAGEPILLTCEDMIEARKWCAVFRVFGVVEPTIEGLDSKIWTPLH